MKVIGQYTCGCSYGPIEKRKRLEYCGTHGGDIQCEYPAPPEKKERTDTRKVVRK
jgi:hypothetical protein